MIGFLGEEYHVLPLLEWSANSIADIFARVGILRGLLILSGYSIDAFKIEGPYRKLFSLLLTISAGLGFAPTILHHLGRGGVGIRVRHKTVGILLTSYK